MVRAARFGLKGALVLTSAIVLCTEGSAIFADLVNIAPLGTATQSTSYPGYPASNAIDGNLGNFTHTNVPDATPFWQVDLGKEYSIESIIVYNRGGGCCPERLRDITVLILAADGTTTRYQSDLINPGNTAPIPTSITLSLEDLAGGPVAGQIVRVARTPDPTGGTSQHDATVVSLGEVQVFVDSSTLPTSILTHPQGARKYVGGCHVFSVVLFNPENSSSIAYKWLKDDVEISGETGPRLILADLQTADAGTYKVVVTADANELTSNPAVLVVPGLDLALTGVATQSTTAFGGTPERANDGNTSGAWASASLSHTDNVDGSWWQVALYGPSTVEQIVLWNRTDCCPERLSNFRVSALDAEGAEVWGGDYFTDKTYPTTTTDGFAIVLPAPTECSTVKIQRLGPDATLPTGLNYLSLAEVEVFGTGPLPPPPALPNIARVCGAMATQSSGTDYPATNAIDGNLANFTHTLGTDSDSWWQIEFPQTYDVAIVVIHNRTSCCGSRLRDITVSVLDENKAPLWTSGLLNPENVLGAFPNGPAQLTVDLRVLQGGPVAGRFVRIHRTADPDFSGGGDGTNPDEANVISLGEVEIYEPPSWCPADGDTHCGGLTVAGPEGGLPGVYVATPTATDDSADEILYTFTAQKTEGPTIVVGPQTAATASLELVAGSWTVSVTVDDDGLCLDAATDATCSQAVEVAVQGENLALGKTATQSSEYVGVSFPASNAVDGNLANFTHTDQADLAPSWQVDLGGEALLYAVLVHNRDDCCGSRLRDITVTVLDAGGDPVWQSPLLNPENVLGAFPLGPAVLTVDLTGGGGPVLGSAVRVSRTPDPDLSGSGGLGNLGEPSSLTLGEVQVFGTLCAAAGDTHCAGVTALPTEVALQVLATATASDDSGDPISYTFTATAEGKDPIVVGPQAESTALLGLAAGTWTVSVAVDDDACSDAATDAACTTQVDVAEPGIGPFLRADVNASGKVDISDGVSVFQFLFLGYAAPPCLAAADAGGEGLVNITSGIYILNFLFLGGPAPALPYPDCGRSSDPDDALLGCAVANPFCP